MNYRSADILVLPSPNKLAAELQIKFARLSVGLPNNLSTTKTEQSDVLLRPGVKSNENSKQICLKIT